MRRLGMLAVVCSLCALTSSASAWHYDTVVEPMSRPAWMEKVVIICESSAWAQPDRKVVNPNVKTWLDAGFTPMYMYPDGFCRLYAPSSDEGWPAECHAEVKAMHAAGMKALAGCYPTVGSRGPRDLLNDHPDWRLRTDENVPEGPGTGCLVSPFGDALIDLLISRIKEYDIDGFQFDGWYQFKYCCCPGCKQRYKEEKGLDIPLKMDTKDPAYLKYLVWRDEKIFDLMVKLQSELKKVKPDAVLVQWNNNDCNGDYPSSMPEAIDCVADWTNKEWWDGYDCSYMWLIKRLRGGAGDRPAGVQPYMFMRQMIDVESGVYHGSSCPMEEVLYRAHKVMTLGSIPVLWTGARTGWTADDSKRVAKEFSTFLPYVHETKSIKYALGIDSYTSLQMAKVPQAEVEQKVGYPRAGVARVLLEEHIPFDVASEHNITSALLAQYKVVVLPNNFCMSDRIADLLRTYVKNGGGLVATFETSLYDVWGEKRNDFLLGDLFGASYLSSSLVCPNQVDYTPAKHPVTDDPAILNLTGTRGYTTYYGKFARVKAGPGTIAPLIGLDVQNMKDETLKNWTPLLLSQRDKGRVAYFPAAIDAAYYDAGYPYERMVFANAIRWAAGAAPDIKITAPKCVLAGFFTKNDSRTNRSVIHLLNDFNSTTGHGSKNDKQFAIREEVVSIAGVKVSVSGSFLNPQK
ncbi:MAG: beta-galactosidase trimerization domain-containing protein, partial [Armatimonadota bacterium]